MRRPEVQNGTSSGSDGVALASSCILTCQRELGTSDAPTNEETLTSTGLPHISVSALLTTASISTSE